jgi:O-antigen ligase
VLTVLFILCALIWILILFHQISQRAFLILLVWLFVAPFVTNLAEGRFNVFARRDRIAWAEREVDHSAAGLRNIRQDIRIHELIRGPSRAVFFLLVAAFLLGALVKRRLVLSFDGTEIWMAAFSILIITSTFLQSQRLLYNLRIVTDAFIVPFSAYYIARRLVKTENQFRQLTRAFGYIACYLIVIGLIERLNYSYLTYRLSGPFGSGNEYYYVLMVMFFGVLQNLVGDWNASNRRHPLSAIVIWFALCLTPVIVFLTWSRGLWLGFVMGVWVFAFLGFLLLRSHQKIRWIGFGIFLVPLVVIGIYALIPEQAFEGRVLNTGTVEWRFKRWMVAIQEGIRNPIFGVGFGNLREILATEAGSSHTAHNFFLHLFAELGIVGVLAFLGVTVSLFRNGLLLFKTGTDSRDCWRGVAVVAVVMGYLVPAVFANTIESAGLMLFYQYVLLGGIAGLYKQPGSKPVAAYRVKSSYGQLVRS